MGFFAALFLILIHIGLGFLVYDGDKSSSVIVSLTVFLLVLCALEFLGALCALVLTASLSNNEHIYLCILTYRA